MEYDELDQQYIMNAFTISANEWKIVLKYWESNSNYTHFIDEDNVEKWTCNGLLHRDIYNTTIHTYEPAYYDLDNKTTMWYNRGKLHCFEDKPASITMTQIAMGDDQLFSEVTLEYYWRGMRHRNDDKPAIFCFHTTKPINTIDLHNMPWGTIVQTYGHLINYQVWCEFDKNHRDDDKPAIIYLGDCCSWYQFGMQHRDNDQPAQIGDNTKEWFQFNVRHRDHNQPSVIRNHIYHEYHYFGEKTKYFE
jgi:hypothetical protein